MNETMNETQHTILERGDLHHIPSSLIDLIFYLRGGIVRSPFNLRIIVGRDPKGYPVETPCITVRVVWSRPGGCYQTRLRRDPKANSIRGVIEIRCQVFRGTTPLP